MYFNRYGLSTQIVFVFVCVFFVAITVLGFYDYNSKLSNLKDSRLSGISAIAKAITESISEDVYSKDYVRIEYKLSGLDGIRQIGIIRVLDAEGFVVADFSRNKSKNLEPNYEYSMSHEVPVGPAIKYISGNHLKSISEIYFSGRTVGWLELISPGTIINDSMREILYEMVLFNFIVLVIVIVAIVVFMNRQLKSLVSLTQFATDLPDSKGSIIQNKHAPPEFRLLMKSLSWASVELEKQHARLKNQNDFLETKVEERTSELKELARKADESSRAKSDFLARMSHELRTPLNAVIGFSQLLEMAEDSLVKDQMSLVNEIHSAGNHLLDMVNEVLEISKIESGEYEIDMEFIKIRAIIEKVISLLGILADKNNIKIKCHFDVDEDYCVYCDALRTRQVILNVVSNAIKYNRENGRIDIEIATEQNELILKIRDTGEGISEADLEKIFIPFERASASSVIEGAGIGLAISSKLMIAMGGDIQVESEPGSGSVFMLRFQLAESEVTSV